MQGNYFVQQMREPIMDGEHHALIIDDNRLNIEVLTMLLQREGIAYTAIETPRALESALADIEAVSVVFLDLEMPNHDGFDLLSELKALPQIGTAPIVAYTVHTSEIDRARRAGFDAFLGKPLNSSRFSEQLARILNGESVWEI